MASTGRDGEADAPTGVELVREDDGRVTARDVETGVASFGDTKADALRMLADALELHDRDDEELSETDLDALGLDSDDFDDRELPEFMR